MVKKIIKKSILKIFPSLGIKDDIKRKVTAELELFLSYAQEGEDKVLDRFLGNKIKGFYVDVGAHHPIRFSNTYLFYKRGWRGINIDAMPGSMQPFKEMRPEDTNLEIPVSSKEEILDFYIFNEPALNTFSKEEADKKNGMKSYKLVRSIPLKAIPLSDILDSYLQPNQNIDFLSIDVEGYDYEVLKSNDWKKYRPDVILVESLRTSLEEIFKDKVFLFLKDQGYRLEAKTYNTLFFNKWRD